MLETDVAASKKIELTLRLVLDRLPSKGSEWIVSEWKFELRNCTGNTDGKKEISLDNKAGASLVVCPCVSLGITI